MRLEARDISFKYGKGTRQILDHVNLTVEPGESVGIMAPSGYGKTTLCKILAGYERPDSGEVLVDGMPVLELRGYCPVQMVWQHPELSVNPKRRLSTVLEEGDWTFENPSERARIEAGLGIRDDWKDRFPVEISGGELYIDGKLMNDVEPKDRDIAMVFQSYALYPHMTVYGNMAFSLKLKKVPKDEIDRRVRQAAEILDITQYLDRKPKALSGGQRQRVAIGRAIVRDPAVFLMDEPLSNLDAKLRNQMRAELIKLRERIDTTFIYVTHDQTEAMTLGDRIVIMKDGFIQQIGTPQEVFDHPANLFVAGFIGTPQMNLFDAHLARRDGKYTVTVGSVTVELSEEKQQRLAAKDVAEQDVVLGVRPDHIMLCADGVKGKVDVSEMMGSSVHLHVAAEGKDVIVIVPTNGAAAHFPAGSEVNMIFGGNVAHVFSKETEKNLEW